MLTLFRRIAVCANYTAGNVLLKLHTYPYYTVSRPRALSFLNQMAEAVEQKIAENKNRGEERYRQKRQGYDAQKPRYNGIVKKRKWEDPPSDPEAVKDFDPASRVKKRKCIILMGYSGVDYLGMQRNPGTKTIEEDLLAAMLKHGWISDEAFKQPQQVQFQRAARTDKGVSAATQVVSIKLPENLNIDALNEDLPAQIRVFAIKRVTKGFNSKSNCDARTYTYTLPTVAFALHGETVDISNYRLPEERLKKVNDTLKLFEGTKNFHNFTSRKEFIDPSAKRFIMSFECDTPFVPEGSTVEFATIKIKGQSFMLHQIRKMVGLTLAVVRGVTPAETIIKAFDEVRYGVPTAPGLGLVLSRIHYEKYNARYGQDGCHEVLDFQKEDDLIQEFFRKHIASTIVETELQTNSMVEWIETLPLHSYEPREDNESREMKGKRKSNDDDEDDDE
ncbi:pseudouridylate synthase 1 homolog [Topomyia yanbarensis]|uniref:pseudouridylate synthase 1 homolog n=1 Tax=Topomyia yanbarensis TaxID=2498891 RepID=UPI00273B7229|nr:pseudouridylate synthase 1 homolog [Topomyia yanbarensis]